MSNRITNVMQVKSNERADPRVSNAVALVSGLPTLCTVTEAATALRTTSRNIKRWIARGSLAGLRVVPGEGSSRVLIPRDSIQALLAQALGGRV